MKLLFDANVSHNLVSDLASEYPGSCINERCYMANRTTLAGLARASAAISSPIPLLAFLGMIVEGVVGALVYTLRSAGLGTPILSALVVAAIALPVLFGGLIYSLLTRHHHKLYAPRDFGNPEDFVRVLEVSQESAGRLNRLTAPVTYRPWTVTSAATDEDLKLLQNRIESWQPIIDAMNGQEFMAIHSWYNERGDHVRALVAIDIAIARGAMASRTFGFRSASLRKLGRMLEARSSAELSLSLDAANVDAHYNLAQVLVATGAREAALGHAKIALERDRVAYGERLQNVFPELRSAR